MPYDEERAFSLLASAHAKKYPGDYATRRQTAAEKLRTAALNVATRAGWTLKKDAEGNDFIQMRSAPLKVYVLASESGIHVEPIFSGKSEQVMSAEIAYDPAADEWVGTDDDKDTVPAPGTRQRKKDALTIVAELIVKALSP
jgi:hypothetical protein